MVVKLLKKTVQRLAAVAAGIILIPLCGYFIIGYFKSDHVYGAGKWVLTPLLVGLLAGLGLLWYGITGKNAGAHNPTNQTGTGADKGPKN